MRVVDALKTMREYEHVVPFNDLPIPYVYKDKDGYNYNYTIFVLAVL